MNVQSGKCIRNLSVKSLKTYRSRNIIAVIAIALTTVLFTSLFTIVMSVAAGFEQSNFRRVGGNQHSGLKNLTEEQFEEFKTDPHIAKYGKRVFIGSPHNVPFNKSQVEISSIDENYAEFTFVDFIEGGLPRENTNEAAADTRVLSLLEVTPEIGAEFTISFDVLGKETTETFTLCGYWEFDEAMPAGNVFLPFSRAEEIFEKSGTIKGADGITGTFSLDFMLKSGTKHIERDVQEIIESHGYQFNDPNGEKYIKYGVNWGYIGTQANNVFDTGTVIAIILLVILIIFTGYLIIYNVFRISVSNDIRYYGLLKTIGTTSKQIMRMIRIEALSLSAIGVPIGLVIGYLTGAVLSSYVISELDGITDTLSHSPVIFIGAALFSVFTVVFSCLKPGKIAASVSPIEAYRYTECASGKAFRKTTKGANTAKMAAANLNRNKSRTVITVLSLSLSAVLLNMTFTFANGFDMDKYLSSSIKTDFHIADAKYYQSGVHYSPSENALTEQIIQDIDSFGEITESGRTYGGSSYMWEYVSEEHLRERYQKWYSPEAVEEYFKTSEKANGSIVESVQLYGMEKFCLDNLNVIEGDISKLYGNENYIAAAYRDDNYGNVLYETNWAKIGDKVTVRYADEVEYYNSDTGNVYERYDDIPENESFRVRGKNYKEMTYEVAAIVVIPSALSYRYYSDDEFILNSEVFIRDSGTSEIMYYVFNADESAEQTIENALAEYTEKTNPLLNYESKNTYAAHFYSLRNMFVILGSALTFIIGLVGILNFINVILTGIFSRRRELAILQSIGMTGKQLKNMLMIEGLCYSLGSVAISLIFTLVFSPFEKKAMEDMFWFFSFKFTILPIISIMPVFGILGAVIPLISYKLSLRKSLVERLRETE